MAEIRTATITERQQLTPHVLELRLQPVGERLAFVPGQWLSLRLPVDERGGLHRAYSLAAPPATDGSLLLCFDRVEEGAGSGYLWEAEEGMTIEFTGPHGNFVRDRSDCPLLFVARYTGIVPFRAMLAELSRQSEKSLAPVHLVYSIPSPSEGVYLDELRALAARSEWLTLLETTDDTIFSDLDHKLPSDPVPLAYVCGIREFTRPLREYLMERFQLERRAVKVEHFS